MKILIVSDTHGRHGNLELVLQKEAPIDMLIHLGDVERGEDYIEAVVDCPMHLLAGNNDLFSHLPTEKEICIGKYKVLLTHGHGYYVSMDTRTLRRVAQAREIDIVMFGHTHKPYLDVDGDMKVLNPGSISYPRQEGRKASYVVMEMDVGGQLKFQLKFL